MAGLVPAIPIIWARCPPNRDRRDKPGDDDLRGAMIAGRWVLIPPASRIRDQMACGVKAPSYMSEGAAGAASMCI
jgi:hypothetical protein